MIIKHKIDNAEGVLNTVIITAFHGVLIERCLKTLVETINRAEHRIIFIEAPASKEHEILYPLIKEYIDIYIKTEKNYGFCKSINLGLGMVYTPYFTVIHDDCWFIHKGWWNELKELIDGNPEMLMIQPTSLNRRGELRDGPEFISEEKYQELIKSGGGGASLSEVYCMLFKKQWLDMIGLFDESIFPVGPEDIEFWRLARAVDKTIGGAGQVGIFHKGVGRAEDGSSGGGPSMIHSKTQMNKFNKKWRKDDDIPGYGNLTSSDIIEPALPNIIRQL